LIIWNQSKPSRRWDKVSRQILASAGIPYAYHYNIAYPVVTNTPNLSACADWVSIGLARLCQLHHSGGRYGIVRLS